MGKNQSASNLPNIIQYNNGSINFVSGSTLLMQISSSGAITTTGVISGSNALSSSYAVNADQLDGFDSSSFVFTSSFNTYSSSMSTRVSNNESTGSTLTTASASFAVVSSSYSTASGSLSTRVTKIEGNYATTGSNIFTGAQTVCANITSTGTIIAQTLNVQQVTSSIVYSSGSNIFGCLPSDVQQFTGSLRVTGSGNHWFQSGCVGIGTTTPCQKFHVFGQSDGTKGRFELYGVGGINEVLQVSNTANWNPGRGVKVGLYVNSGSNQSQIGAEIGAVTIAADALGADLFFNVASAGVATERFRITSTGIACFACQICAPSFLSSGTICSAGNTTIAGCLGIGTNSPSSYCHGGSNRVVEVYNCNTSANSQSHIILSTGASTTPGAIGSVTWVIPNSSAANKMGSYMGADIEADSSTAVCTNIFLATRNNETTPQLRLRIFSAGIACFSCQICVGGMVALTNTSFGTPATEAAFRIRMYDNGGVNNDPGIGLDGAGGGGERMWFNALGGFYMNLGTGGSKFSMDSTGISCFANTVCAPTLLICNGTIFLQRGANTCNGLIIGEQGGTVSADKAVVIRTAGGTSQHLFLTPGIDANTNACGYIRLGGDRNSCVGINMAPTYALDICGYAGGVGTMRIYSCFDGGGIGMIHLTSNGTEGGGMTFEKTSGTAQKFKFGNQGCYMFLYNETAGFQPLMIAKTGEACFACAVCSGASIFASTNIRVSTGTSAGNSSDPAITTGGCTKTGIYFAGSCVGLGSGGNGVLLNAGGTLFPAANGTQDLGTSSLRWCTVYTSDLSLNNGIGDYTIVEGENDLFLYNNKQCKVYKFVVQEVCPEIAPAKRSI